jgi:hypothetical protein
MHRSSYQGIGLRIGSFTAPGDRPFHEVVSYDSRASLTKKPFASASSGSYRVLLEIHATADIAEIEAVKFQRHVILVHIYQVERGIVEVLVHSVKVESRRLDGLVEGEEPIPDV